MKANQTYIYAASRPWSLAQFVSIREQAPGRWIVVTTTADLLAAVELTSPRYIFFPHWSQIVPEALVNTQECVCFHMTDLPYGRGGSPLQNLIENGHSETMLTALRMTSVLDGGPIYGKRPLTLEGSAEQIFNRAGELIGDMIQWIVASEPQPEAQTGEPTIFKRRAPAQSRITAACNSPKRLYDHIRMLDAPGYPKAFLEEQGWLLEFDRARLEGEEVEARVRFIPRDKDQAS